MSRVLIIAEAGVNHNGNLELAKKLIDEAAAAGADIVKFQTFRSEKLVAASAQKAEYQKQTTNGDESQLDMLRRLELGRAQHVELIQHCNHRHIEFFSTAFDHESIELLVELGLKKFKVPSGELTNVPYLRHIARYGMPVILSTGMASLGEIELAIETLERAGLSRETVTVLQCNTEYPTPMSDVNLRAMLSIRDAFQVSVGYSDHTQGIEIPIAAVALGAQVIEKHFTLDRALPGPDHAASLEPGELKAMIQAIRNVEMAMGDGIKRPSASELPNRAIARKSIVAASAIKAGDIFNELNLAVKRPGTGLSPVCWDTTLGRTARRDFATDELIEW